MYKSNKNAKQNSKRQHLHIFHTVQVYKEHEIKYKPLTILHFLWSSGFSPLFCLSVAFDVASSSGVKTSLINPFSIFLSGLVADKQLFGYWINWFYTPLNFHFLTKVSCFYHSPRKKEKWRELFLLGGQGGIPQPEHPSSRINPSKVFFPPQ